MIKWLETILLALVAVFAPEKTVILSTLALVLCDLVTGIWAARKQGQAITSTDLKRTVGKLVLYELAVCVSFLCQKYLTGTAIPVSSMAASMIGLTEITSIIENLNTISGTNLFQSLLSKITQNNPPAPPTNPPAA